MGREIVCVKCSAPRGVRIGDDPFEVAQRCAEKTGRVHGLARGPMLCDSCNLHLTVGDPAVAVSTAPVGMPEPNMAWAAEYLEVPDAR